MALYYRHPVFKVTEITPPSLVNQGVSVRKKQDAFFNTCLPQPINYLVGHVSFSGSSGHDQKNPVVASCNGFDSAVDGNLLIVSRLPATSIKVIVLGSDSFLVRATDPLVLLVFFPKFRR